jgi:hypothetical protein
MGVSVFGSPGFARDWAGPNENDRLARVVAPLGIDLDLSATSLRSLDERWADLGQDPEVRASLANDVGLYLGRVIVADAPGARWVVWPNGHPVVRTPAGRDLDVVGLVGRRVGGEGPNLIGLLDVARSTEGRVSRYRRRKPR